MITIGLFFVVPVVIIAAVVYFNKKILDMRLLIASSRLP